MNQDNNKILIYTSDDGQVKIEVRLEKRIFQKVTLDLLQQCI